MTQLDHCVLANEILGPVLSCRSVHFKMASTTETHEFLVRAFPLEHKKLMFMFMIMLMLMILMSLVGTKLYAPFKLIQFSPIIHPVFLITCNGSSFFKLREINNFEVH